MKGRSHRFQSSDPHEDWVDGSWTVDCVCGVNFDDGEEMVNCDECGVWVHTRCSRYVKGEELFACDKCKSKNNRNDSEETEVAQLLVELPTKTMKMESSYAANGPPRRPFRLWTDIPMEERVHVQGIPGGDPTLFGGLSSVFTPELWKCTGYVPKKFNFQYREFPCWDEEERDTRHEEDNENPVDKGAGVLFSLSKDNVLATPVAALVGMRGRDGDGDYDRKMYSKEMKKWEGEDVDFRRSQNGVKKERSLLRPVVIHSGKRKKQELGTSRDRSAKKKARATEKEADEKKRGAHAPKTVFRPASDAKQLEFYEDRGVQSLKTDVHSIKSKNSSDTVLEEPTSDGYLAVGNGVEKPEINLAVTECSLGALSPDMSRRNFSNGAGPKEDKDGQQVPSVIKSSPKTDDVVTSVLEQGDARGIPVKEEGENKEIDKLDDGWEASARNVVKPPVEDMPGAAPAVKGNQILQELNGDICRSSVQPNVEVKIEVNDDNVGGLLNAQSSLGGAKDPGIFYDHISVISNVHDAAVSSLQPGDNEAQDVDRSSQAVSDCHTDKADELSGDPCEHKRELNSCLDGSVAVPKSSSESRHGSGFSEEPSKSGRAILSSPLLSSQRKMVVSVGKSSSTSSTTMISKSSASDNLKPADTQSSKSNPDTKQQVMFECNASLKNECDVSDVVRGEDRHDISRKTVKEHPKSSANSASKASQSSRISHAAVSKRPVSDSKDSVLSSSSKVHLAQNPAVTSGSGESAGSLQSQGALHVQNKASASGLPQKGDKFYQSNFQPSSKVNHAPSMHPPAPSTTLSDEELALLLHQELNSSPRVPRVPRVRHTGSLPQLASPTATSMLMKRTYSSGGKDHSSVSRRKSKDASKDGFRSSRELDDEAKKSDRVPSSPDPKRQDIGCAVDASMRREDNGSPTMVHSTKKNMPPVSTTSANSGPSSSTEANDHNMSSIRNSPRNISDDDTGTVRGPVHRTLPGLINEIMSKGRRMTCDELCNAVLPHWHNLRKHNGERYAYSSHSQAVLDCLRNRHEWARLVDRGPKTNSSRKRRKLDPEESEDSEYGKGRTAKEVEGKSLESQKEEFPKGKRKARKRRRLALQGRVIQDVRKRRNTDFSDDETGPFSNSSEESMFSEDEIQGGGACAGGSEASASSDETGAM